MKRCSFLFLCPWAASGLQLKLFLTHFVSHSLLCFLSSADGVAKCVHWLMCFDYFCVSKSFFLFCSSRQACKPLTCVWADECWRVNGCFLASKSHKVFLWAWVSRLEQICFGKRQTGVHLWVLLSVSAVGDLWPQGMVPVWPRLCWVWMAIHNDREQTRPRIFFFFC